MAYPVKSVANCFLEYAFKNDIPISPLKLQKLVYFLHGWHLAITDQPAIDEPFEAWPYGPVDENLYHIFKSFGNGPITIYAESWENREQVAYVVNRSNREFYDIFDMVIRKYMDFTPAQLSSMTHAEDTPWDITKKRHGKLIDNNVIKQYFRSLVRK